MLQCVLGLFPGGKAAGVWCWQLTPSNADVKERIQLYLCPLWAFVACFFGVNLNLLSVKVKVHAKRTLILVTVSEVFWKKFAEGSAWMYATTGCREMRYDARHLSNKIILGLAAASVG